MKIPLTLYVVFVAGHALASVLGYYFQKYRGSFMRPIIRDVQEWTIRVSLIILAIIIIIFGFQVIERATYYPHNRLITLIIVIAGYLVVLFGLGKFWLRRIDYR